MKGDYGEAGGEGGRRVRGLLVQGSGSRRWRGGGGGSGSNRWRGGGRAWSRMQGQGGEGGWRKMRRMKDGLAQGSGSRAQNNPLALWLRVQVPGLKINFLLRSLSGAGLEEAL